MKNGQGGFSLVEVAVAASVLCVGTLGFLAVMAGTIQMDSQSAESVVALRAAQDKLDEIWNLSRLDYEAVYDTYAGTTFEVDGLDGEGTVTIYSNEATARALMDLSLDLDLDRNGVANEDLNKDPVDLRFLPVRVRIEWQTPFGVRTHDLDTFVYNREEE
jgi:hypothetical protein